MTTESYDYDLIVIGAGSGGVRAARISASYGAKVAVIEESRPGGTCVIRGCVPKKLLVYGASFAQEFEDAMGFGWELLQPSHDWSKLIAAKDTEITRLEQIYRNLLANAGADLIEGTGKIIGPHEVRVGDNSYTASAILVAVGGWPNMPDIPGLQDHAITSNELLDLPARPQSIVIQGAGYIALEFASLLNALGTETHLVYRADLPLRGFDQDVREHVTKSMEQRGVILHPQAEISLVDENDGHKIVSLNNGTSIKANIVMSAAGRRPKTDGLGLSDVGVEQASNGAIKVNKSSQSSVPSIYAVGDVTDRVNLTPVAIGEGHALADTLFGNMPRVMSHDTIASAVFCTPQIASVGLSQEEAEKKGQVTIFESRFRAMRNTLSGRQEQSYMKLIVDTKSDKILGVHMVGPDSAEIMQGIAIAVKMGATKADFDATVGIHPTAAEEFVTMRTPKA
ncbi:MAG: glutathione-disulfide reductase [Candidatus Puniceispirillaceae bacterium]